MRSVRLLPIPETRESTSNFEPMRRCFHLARSDLRLADRHRARFGERKVEADALVTRPQARRQLCEAAILKYVDRDGIKRFERAVARKRKEMRLALDRLLKVGRR